MLEEHKRLTTRKSPQSHITPRKRAPHHQSTAASPAIIATQSLQAVAFQWPCKSDGLSLPSQGDKQTMPSTWLEKVVCSTLCSPLASLPHLQGAKPPLPLPNLLFSPASIAPGSWHGCQPAAAQIQAWRRRALLSWVCLLSCAFAWGGFEGKPRYTTLSGTGANPCSRGGGKVPAPNCSQLSSDSFSLHRRRGSQGVPPCPRVWGEPCHREGAAAKGPPLPLSQARSARWRMGCHGNGICSASAPREAAGPQQHPPATIYF